MFPRINVTVHVTCLVHTSKSKSEFNGADGTLSDGSLKGCSFDNGATWASNIIDPDSAGGSGEQVMVQGEAAIPAEVQRLPNNSPLYPHR